MRRVALRVDEKGRIQTPKEIREELGIRTEANVTIDAGRATIEPVERIYDRLATEVRFNFEGVIRDLPNLRRSAEKELLKQVP